MLVMFNKKKAGFTLLELLVVIAIIAILAAFLIPALDRVQERAVIAYTETMISNLRLAISMFDTDTGNIPVLNNPLTGTVPSPSLRRQLATDVDWTPPAGWAGSYMEFRAEDLSGERIIDPWGRAYRFFEPPTPTDVPTGFTPAPPAGHAVYIWSLGPEVQFDAGGNPRDTVTGDEITSW